MSAGARGAARPKDYGIAAAGALGISIVPVLVVLSQAAPTPVAILRFAYALPVLLVIALVRPDARRALFDRRWMSPAALGGAFFACDILFWHRSIALAGAGIAALAVSTQVIFVALYGLLFLKERPRAGFWAAIPIVGAGLACLALAKSTPGATNPPLGILLGAVAGLSYAGVIVCLRRAQLRAPVPPEPVLIVQIGVALVAALVAGHVEGSWPAPLARWQHGWLLLLGAGPQALAWILIGRGIRRVPGHHGAALLLAQPAGTLLLAWWILDEAPSPLRVMGALLVLAGVSAALWADRHEKEPAAT